MAEYLQPEKKQELFEKYGKTAADTGSPESQVALFTYRIAHLTEHVKQNKKDVVTRRALLRLVGKRFSITSRKSTSNATVRSSRTLACAAKPEIQKGWGWNKAPSLFSYALKT